MVKIVVVMGVAGSGKTTVGTMLADAMHCAFLEGDSQEMNRQFAWAAGKSEVNFRRSVEAPGASPSLVTPSHAPST